MENRRSNFCVICAYLSYVSVNTARKWNHLF